MDAQLKLFAGVLVNEGGPVDRVLVEFGRKRSRTDYLYLVPLGCLYDLTAGAVYQLGVIRFDAQTELLPLLDRFSHSYFVIFVTTPAPTVLPPSRIANRCLSSSATGAMSLTWSLMVSPGMTISVPS